MSESITMRCTARALEKAGTEAPHKAENQRACPDCDLTDMIKKAKRDAKAAGGGTKKE